jgi:predicted O-linked N-acetylglucosamine transferase (SPINDLY family)
MASSGESLLNEAIAYLQSGRPSQAEKRLRLFLTEQPSHWAALNILGAVLTSQQKYKEAEPYFRSAVEINSGSDATYYNYGIVLKGLGRPLEALECFNKALAINSTAADTWNNRGTVFNDLERYEDAITDFEKAAALHPNDGQVHCNKGHALEHLRRYDEALAAYDQAILLKPDLAEARLGRGTVLIGLKRYEEAVPAYDWALSLAPNLGKAWLGRGIALTKMGRWDAAIADYERALALAPDDVEAELGRGNALTQLRHYDEAQTVFDSVLAREPKRAEAWLGRGNILYHLKRPAEALVAYDQAIALKPGLAEAWLGRGSSAAELKRYDDALSAFDRALALSPDLVAAVVGLGHVYFQLMRHGDASAEYDKAIGMKPDSGEAWLGLANVLTELGRYEQAFSAYDRALSSAPSLADVRFSRANAYLHLKRYGEAVSDYDIGLTLDPTAKYVPGFRLHAKHQMCDWTNIAAEWTHLISAVRGGAKASNPFIMLGGPSSAADQLKCAQIYSADQYLLSTEPLWQGQRYSHDKIRIAYLSADFRDHPVSHLLAGLFEKHDRERFETTAIALGPDNQSEMRSRLKRAFDRFIDVHCMSDRDAASLVRESEIDIVVDLTGFTSGGRPDILALRPAPIQVNYLGYAGTTGAQIHDYVLADRWVIPEDHRELFTESVVYLPDTFMGYVTKHKISEHALSRSEQGLPETGFVFCGYNNSYKITPQIFEIWMRLLKEVEGSVLWLAEMSAAAKDNLRREAQAHGVEPARLCFAPYEKNISNHLARYRLADLYLDTLPFNAHSTACDALWGGLPVLTCLGSSFAGRVAASVLTAVGLPELITRSLDEYEVRAIKLAKDAPLLAGIRAKLAHNRDTQPLFNGDRFTLHIEGAFTVMWKRYQQGQRAASFTVEQVS